jgi:aryl-alcohol dehydrogenase-like predicted oxidoreductase
MRTRILGNTGIAVSELAFGSLFASSLGPGFEESKAAVHKALDLGVNYFDTAPAYANSEEILGRILADVKTPIVLSTKLGGRPLPFEPQNPASVRAVEKGSLPADVLRRLDAIAALVPFRPFEEPMILPFNRPSGYYGPGMANVGAGVKVGAL